MTTPARRRWPTLLGLGLALGLSLRPAPASAWDPSTTHQGLLELAVQQSAMHLRWMDASELERGVFSGLRVDPDALDHDQLRLLQKAMRWTHSDLGAHPLGGPGSCPPADAPPETQLFCVDRELWQQSALGWIRLGMIAEVSPPARHVHHFLDRDQPDAATWQDRELPAPVLRARQARTNGEPRAGVATRTNFAGAAPSAVAWLEDPDDLLAPTATYAHLRLATTAPSAAERDHHLALGLVGVGALLHVVQDLSVPAHARGDATAFFLPLSPAAGDRGLPLQEFVRVEFGRRSLPTARVSGPVADGRTIEEASGGPSGVPLSPTLLGHVLGDGQYDGLATLARSRFLSESSLPAPAYLDATLTARDAAATVLGDDHGLEPAEVDGAVLSPWPAEAGYLLSPSGRALAAFDLDVEGRVRLYLDEVCYRDQAAILLPEATDVTRSLLDLLWPAWPTMVRVGDDITLALPDEWTQARLHVFVEDDRGDRRVVGAPQPIDAGSSGSVATRELAEGERVVLVLTAERGDGPPVSIEHNLASAPTTAPEPPIEPAPIEPQPTEPLPADPSAAEQPDAEPDAAPPNPPEPDTQPGTQPGTGTEPDTEGEPGPPAEPESDSPASEPG